eukprot:TRINITY_DN9516_c0_g1_i4.p2 TRINITY_DN9516_c0_g1~~TRINITY_DN9516_c0_g1_i4.p2  ORF type:complete len:304 (+),score=43.79 TRINITY_DN9516_c0_g1_i4:1298-2209(+)
MWIHPESVLLHVWGCVHLEHWTHRLAHTFDLQVLRGSVVECNFSPVQLHYRTPSAKRASAQHRPPIQQQGDMRASYAQTYRLLAAALARRQTVLRRDGAACVQGYCMHACTGSMPLSIPCLLEMWLLVGCHPNALHSPLLASQAQLQYWLHHNLNFVLRDMLTIAYAARYNWNPYPYNCYAVHDHTRPELIASILTEDHDDRITTQDIKIWLQGLQSTSKLRVPFKQASLQRSERYVELLSQLQFDKLGMRQTMDAKESAVLDVLQAYFDGAAPTARYNSKMAAVRAKQQQQVFATGSIGGLP